MQLGSVQVALLLGWFIIISTAAPAARAPASLAANVMALEGTYPELDAPLKVVRTNEPDLAEYLSNPDSVCTFFIPTAQAMQFSVKSLGRYAGLAAQNKTLGRTTLNYHVVPGVALTADQVGRNTTRAMSRANETIYFWRNKGQPFVYARPDFPSALNRTNIKAGKCIVHSIDLALVPPTANSMVQAWLEEVGNMPKSPPKAQWAPIQEPLPGSIEAGGAKVEAASATAQAPAKSSSDSWRSNSLLARAAALLVAALATAVVL